MICPMLMKGHQANWIAEHPRNFECVDGCAWLMMSEVHDKMFGVCAAAFLAANVQQNLSTICNIKDVTEGKQSPRTDKTTG